MTNPVNPRNSLERIKEIHRLSKKVNKKSKRNHAKILLKFMKEHIEEIEELYAKKDKHSLTETGDLIILCCEFLIEHRVSIDQKIDICCFRFENKLKNLLKV